MNLDYRISVNLIVLGASANNYRHASDEWLDGNVELVPTDVHKQC